MKTLSKEDLSKIDFLVEQKFPHYKSIPPVPTLRGPNALDDIKREVLKETAKKGNIYKTELIAKPRDDVLALFDQVWKAKVELEEQQRFYNQPNAKADYAYWAKMSFWTVEEGVSLLLGKNPRKVSWEKLYKKLGAYNFTESPFVKKYRDILELAGREVKAGVLNSTLPLGTFLAWAERKDFDAPEELVEQVKKYSSAATTNERTQASVDVRDSHPLAELRSMANLKFKKIKINLDIDNQIARIKVKGKGKGKETLAFYSSLGLVNKNNAKNNAQGDLLEKIARETYDPVAIMKLSTMGRLSRALREAFNLLDDEPFSKGKPVFKITIPKDKEAKFKADRKTSVYKEGMVGNLWEAENDTENSASSHDSEAWSEDHDPDYDPNDPIWSDRD